DDGGLPARVRRARAPRPPRRAGPRAQGRVVRAVLASACMNDLEAQFGQIDIYLFDQLLRGRIHPGLRVLDAGCGQGRNLVYLLRAGYEVFGTDPNAEAIESVRRLA